MNWYKIAKQEFSFIEEEQTLWKKMLKDEMDRSRIFFDLENNDNVGDIRRFKLGIKGNGYYEKDEYAVLAQMQSAGGDWENPVVYFKCELTCGKRRLHKFIYIPEPKDGNANLEANENGKYDWSATYNSEVDWKDRDETVLWKALKRRATEVAKMDKADDIEYTDPTFMKNLADRD